MAGIWERTLGWGACAAAVLLLAAALLAARVEAAAGLSASDAVVRLATVPGRPAAGYMTLRGGPATLVAVASPLAERVEMHSTTMAGGMMKMESLAAALVRADRPFIFKPGGAHLMIFGLQATKPGAVVPLVLRFDDGRTLKVEARAVAPGAAMTGHGH